MDNAPATDAFQVLYINGTQEEASVNLSSFFFFLKKTLRQAALCEFKDSQWCVGRPHLKTNK